MTAAAEKPHLSREHLLFLLRQMIRIRRFEDKCAELYTQEKIRGFMHLYDGEEAVAVGVIPVLEARDRIVATYREHGHALVRGLPMTKVMAEMYGKQEGLSRGRGGSMHLFNRAANFHGGNAIVGGGLPLSIGLALAEKMRKSDVVTACFFGEGAVAEGEFHESMNLAALWELPVLFVCENNLYAMGTALAISESETDIERKAACYRIPAEVVDGMDVIAVEAAARRAVHAVRESRKPYFLECRTYRFRAHSMFDAQLYRDKAEVDAWRQKGPIGRLLGWLTANHMIHPDDAHRIDAEVDAEIGAAIAFAEAGTWEPVEQLTRFVYAESGAAANR
jgi:pyruvate dehydrogenase E1 component subunit alpha